MKLMYFSILHKRRRFIWPVDAIVRQQKGRLNEYQGVIAGKKSSLFDWRVWDCLKISFK